MAAGTGQQFGATGRRQVEAQQPGWIASGSDRIGQRIAPALALAGEVLRTSQGLDLMELVVHSGITDAGHSQAQAAALSLVLVPVDPVGREASRHYRLPQWLEGGGLSSHQQLASRHADGLYPQRHPRDQGQAAPAAAEQPHQVVAGHVFHNPPAGLGGNAIAAHQADADQLIAHAEMALVQAAGESPGHQAAHRSGAAPQFRCCAPGPVHRQPLPALGQGVLQIGQGQPGLHGDREVIHGVVDDSVQPTDAHGRSGLLQWRSPVQAGC